MSVTLSIIITSYKEPQTVGAAIEALAAQCPAHAELLVVCPDPETIAVVDAYTHRYAFVRHVADAQRGKPAAINAGLRAARGEIILLSDGDVRVAQGALAPLLAPFDDPRVGAVSGRPVSVSPRDTVLGYWSHLLVDSAHHVRLARDRAGQFLVASGYLLAFRRALLEQVPQDALAEDAVISHTIAQRGYVIRYAPQARVSVKYPATYGDWLRQKVRSAGGYAQPYVRRSPYRMRSARLEFTQGARLALRFPRRPREFLWSLLLFPARLHLWLLVFLKVRLLRRPLRDLWQRVETTKGV